MIAQSRIPITPDMTAGELHDIMAETGANLLVETINSVKEKTYTLTTQDESKVSKAPKIHKKDCEIRFRSAG